MTAVDFLLLKKLIYSIPSNVPTDTRPDFYSCVPLAECVIWSGLCRVNRTGAVAAQYVQYTQGLVINLFGNKSRKTFKVGRHFSPEEKVTTITAITYKNLETKNING